MGEMPLSDASMDWDPGIDRCMVHELHFGPRWIIPYEIWVKNKVFYPYRFFTGRKLLFLPRKTSFRTTGVFSAVDIVPTSPE
jgi:hypothetical protein